MSIPRVTRTASTGTAITRPVTRARVVAPVAGVRAHVPLPATVAYTILLMGESTGLSAEVLGALRQALLSAQVNALGERLRQMAGSGMPEAIVPFHRDPIDVAFASLMAGEFYGSRFSGEGMCVEAGYFAITRSDVTYIDTVGQGAVSGAGPKEEMLERQSVEGILEDHRPDDTVELKVPKAGQGDHLMHFSGPRVMVWGLERGSAEATLLRAGPSRGADTERAHITQSRLGKLSFVGKDNCLLLDEPRVERLMELQAASVDQSPGYSSWLMLEHNDSRFLGPLPDLTEPGAKQAGWWCPDLHLGVRLKATSGPSVMLSFEHAVAVLSHVPWAAINDPVQWLEVALAALPLRPQRRYK